MTTLNALSAVDAGFTRKAALYDDYCARSVAVQWALGVIRQRVLALIQPGARVLELNAGTGRDALWLAERGMRVHATDVASGMLASMERKAREPAAGGRMTVERLPFETLARTRAQEPGAAPSFDLVFSNFGGLNCSDDLNAVARGLPDVLRPGGHVLWVVMPPVCPWELAQAMRGHFGVAFRRLRRGGTLANIEGAQVQTRYYTPRQVLDALGPGFVGARVRSLALLSPPAFMEGFPIRFPRVHRALTRCDEILGPLPILRSAGDYFMLDARYQP